MRSFVFGPMLLVVCMDIGCAGRREAPNLNVELAGSTVRLCLPADCPLRDAVSLRTAEWESETGAKVQTLDADASASSCDLRVVSGSALPTASVPAIPEAWLDAPGVDYRELPATYRLAFNQHDRRPIAVPLAGDAVFLWYRADLFDDPELSARFQKSTGRPLGPPATWEQFLELAKFFRQSEQVTHGCVEAMDRSPDAVRNFFAHSAAYVKGPNWSSFALDSETGSPRLDTSGFEVGLVDWLATAENSPAAGGVDISPEAARRLFCAGTAAMIIDHVPPTVDTSGETNLANGIAISLCSLPGALSLFPPGDRPPEKLETPNQCAHLATTGWFLVGGATDPAPPVARLFCFLSASSSPAYLAQTSRFGLLPIHPASMADPTALANDRLSLATNARLLAVVQEAYSSANWVADLRVSLAEPLLEALALELTSARTGAKTPGAALNDANRAWEAIIAPQQQRVRQEYRRSLGLPPLE